MTRPPVIEGIFVISIPETPGVYILVFHLAKPTSIAFDRKGTQHTFPPGWYLYVGSACGVGGLNRRLTRHQRRIADDKKMHWNVDYFREHALLCELWYCETDECRFEHHWAQTVADLSGATVPVPKFGASDCKADCPSHFFHPTARPSTAVFRSQLSTRELSTTVSVEFIAEPRGKRPGPELQRAYFLGRHFLERRNLAIRDSDLERSKWTSLAKRRPARRLAESVAKEMTVPFPKFKEAIKFAAAVETLIEYCGESAWSALFDPKRPQTRKAILSLSRTSDVRQRHRINGVIKGKFPSVAPHSDDTVFDTTSFAEVRKRLARARGSLGKLLVHLKTIHDSMIVEEVGQLGRLCRWAAELLDEYLTNRGTPSPVLPDDLSKESVLARVRSKAVRGRAVGWGRAALRLTVKNVWDFEEMMRRGLGPTASQLQIARSEIEWIREIASQIERQ
jgi:Uri superfamily endonuclease